MSESKDGPIESFAEQLRRARLKSGLSLGAAAELLELDRKHLGDLEHGRATASREECQRVLSLLEDAADTGQA